MDPRERWRAARSEAKYTIRQTLLRHADADERELRLAEKRGDDVEAKRLGALVEAGRAAIAVLDDD